MLDVRGKLCDFGSVPGLKSGPRVICFPEHEDQRFMVRENRDAPVLQRVTKVLDRKVDGQELTVKNRVT